MAGALDERAMRKAQLLEAGYVFVPEGLEVPGPVARSTAGPDAGERAVVFEVDGLRVRMRLSDDPHEEFTLAAREGALDLHRRGKPYALGVAVVPNVLHAPGMAFVNVESGCAMDCKFCATPHLRRESRKRMRKEQWLDRLLEAAARGDVNSIGITAGVSGVPGKTVDDIVWIVRELRKVHPEVPVGVEPYVESVGEVERIKAAGATEIKLNLQTFDREIFARVCPGWDFDRQLRMLEGAARVFGRERVTANLLVGLGESDENVEAALRFLFGLGIVPTVRALRWNDINREHLEEALGGPVPPVSAERLVRLARMEHRMLEAAGLSALHYRTMCHACGACDMVPETDLVRFP
ncbi:MAG TPA: radical SAM protein [Candidatus Thermoplasmatota archaeon]